MSRLALPALVLIVSSGALGCNSCGKNLGSTNVEVEVAPASSGIVGASSASTSDCTRLCRAVGKCSVRDGKCYAGSDRDCRASFACRTVGYCSLVGDKCGATSDKDCADAEICKVNNKCTARDGRCVEPVSMSDQ